MAWAYFGTWHFGMNISSRGPFRTRTFWHENISAWVYFCTMDVSAQGRYSTWTLQHKDILAHGLFSICTFWHYAKQYRHFGKGVLLPNVHVPKYPCAKMSQCHNVPCRNVHGAKKSPCQNVLVLKYPCAKMSPWWNVCFCVSMFPYSIK